METINWPDLLKKVSVIGGPLNTATDSDIHRFETKAIFPLPPSYAAYCKVFGAGALSRPANHQIYAPVAGAGSDLDLLEAFQSEVTEYKADYKTYCKEPGRFERARFFGTDIATSYYFWDHQDTTQSFPGEYGIYILQRGWRIEKVANTFWDYVNEICLADIGDQPTEWTFEVMR